MINNLTYEQEDYISNLWREEKTLQNGLNKEIEPSQENSKVLSQFIAIQINKERKKNINYAEDLINSIKHKEIFKK